MTSTEQQVALREPFPIEYGLKLWAWLNEPLACNFDDYSPKNLGEFLPVLTARIQAHRTWAIDGEDGIIGFVAVSNLSPIAVEFQGIALDPKHRRRGLGQKTLNLLIEQLRGEGIETFVGKPFVDNWHARNMLKEVGFAHTGFILNATRRDGQLIDVEILCLTKERA